MYTMMLDQKLAGTVPSPDLKVAKSWALAEAEAYGYRIMGEFYDVEDGHLITVISPKGSRRQLFIRPVNWDDVWTSQ